MILGLLACFYLSNQIKFIDLRKYLYYLQLVSYSEENKEEWLFEISSKRGLFELDYKELWRYRDLLFLFVKRDIVTFYKQTILGPIWFIIQPLITSLIQFVIFSQIANIPSDDTPYFLFVLAGNVLWFYFSDCFKSTSEVFKTNQNLFGKVYFPRLIMPLAIVFSNLVKFGIQFLFFLGVLFYCIYKGYNVHPNLYVLYTPLLLLVMILLSLGSGMIITSLTTKYRDLTFVVTFGISLYMYVTPIVYPTSLALEKLPESLHYLVYLNPLTSIFDFFKYAFLGSGTLDLFGVLYSLLFSIIIFFAGVFVFNKTEKNFIDVI
ncbi:lipopolysaccharide transport system permease protein [Flavobacterium swingsii]|uniref:Transport permease protein n=2 Tax=Flavobacterium swingsii TaxID=498292 RepID=A0A1I0Z977_9FLAO|nr:lipopolysaccharide transport system permease protein [Flavobacterium swingsii]